MVADGEGWSPTAIDGARRRSMVADADPRATRSVRRIFVHRARRRRLLQPGLGTRGRQRGQVSVLNAQSVADVAME